MDCCQWLIAPYILEMVLLCCRSQFMRVMLPWILIWLHIWHKLSWTCSMPTKTEEFLLRSLLLQQRGTLYPVRQSLRCKLPKRMHQTIRIHLIYCRMLVSQHQQSYNLSSIISRVHSVKHIFCISTNSLLVCCTSAPKYYIGELTHKTMISVAISQSTDIS